MVKEIGINRNGRLAAQMGHRAKKLTEPVAVIHGSTWRKGAVATQLSMSKDSGFIHKIVLFIFRNGWRIAQNYLAAKTTIKQEYPPANYCLLEGNNRFKSPQISSSNALAHKNS